MKHDLTDIMATLEVSHATLNMIADRIDNYTRTLGSPGANVLDESTEHFLNETYLCLLGVRDRIAHEEREASRQNIEVS